ncbi:disease resistance protein RGA5 [Aegilops tauschii subsp. strangulata]|uniref:WRKY domain-containing protein n=2 Tax=Aegilops tauschii subsp. strangulata TaxID=200361 RepID=A0A453DSB5_AEGTS|nr:disease resistance protein RGA5 isoform X1 [Aegilops tauschii subsp. strangulata]XP_020165043.1 disease resistance protein RGA5 isoform X1 [Aegilops tauschii subsp. strangulata]XP_040259159.1 disease resistance protein RGA5 isoform X1 [Aegilops tauschii subsp. strangulata]
MEAAVVSVSRGAIGFVIAKLGDLLAGKYKLLKGAKGEIMFLKAELESMRAFLERMSEAEEEPDKQSKLWAKEVCDLSYDIEDSVDEFIVLVECESDCEPHGFKGFIHRSMNLLTTMNIRHRIAKEFRGLKSRVVEVSERRMRYKIDDVVSKQNKTTIDLRLLALYADTAGLVGIDGPKNELIRLMAGEEGGSAQPTKVLSIVGFGGLGKTTLANQIYQKLKWQFQCQAFVSVSQKPSIRIVLRRMLSQVGYVAREGADMEIWAEDELISELRKFLMDKRYFIVIDDIWDETTWNVIRCALPENLYGSMIITTTRINSVARACCCNQHDYIYKMKTLSNEDSRKLFFRRVFGSEDACPLYLEEVSTQILKRCGGLPLAIVTISSLLASERNKFKEHWVHIMNSLGPNFEVNPTLEGMRQILSLSYINLPHYLKTCMLYLGMYPEDYIIWKNDLVRQWVAQGFVSKAHGKYPEDVAEGYFNELVNRGIIQPVNTDHNNEVLSCRLHDMMLDLIIHKCRDENFITAPDDIQDMIGLSDKVRRLSLYLDGIIDGTILETTQLSQVRALARFGNSAYAPPLLKFKHLRVLSLEFRWEIPDLTGISHLFQLRYLKIKTDGKIQVPSGVVHLGRLQHLIVPRRTILPNGIGNMKSLCTLQEFDVGLNSIDNIRDLGDLINLRDLRICGHLSKMDELHDMERRQRLDVLTRSLEKLCDLRYLHMDYNIKVSYVLSSLFLRRLHMLCPFPKVPNAIGELHNLFDLDLTIEVLEDDIAILAQLQSLNRLKLHIEGKPETEEKVVICRKGFPVLKHFWLFCVRMSQLTFEAGTMPSLEKLEVRINSPYGAAPMGIEHLLGLKEIFVFVGGCGGEGSCSIRAALTLLRKAIDMRSSRPAANIKCVDNLLLPEHLLDDGFSWRKYGQKDILDAKHPRAYYRCTYRKSQGCSATKEVQRTDDDPELFLVLYKGKHTCIMETSFTGAARDRDRLVF